MKEKVIWLEGMGHYTALAALPRVLREMVSFYGQDLPPGITAPAVPADKELPPVKALASFLQKTSEFLTRAPAPGRCHYIDIQANATAPDGKTNSYQFSFVRGENGQFHLKAGPVPELDTLNIGCGEYPWMLASNGKLFAGNKSLNGATNISDFLDSQGLLRLQLLSGAVFAFSVAPEAFAQYLQVADEPGAPGERVLGIKLTHKSAKGSVQVCFQRDTMTPKTVSISLKNLELAVAVRLWSLDAVNSPELYRPPDSTNVQEVAQQDLLRMFAAAFNFFIEKTQ